MLPRETIAKFDAYLAERDLSFEAVVIGGAALGLLGVVTRQTRDCDILCPALPSTIRDAARSFAQEQRAVSEALADDWLNDKPSLLAAVLPDGWMDRLQPVFAGRAVTLRCLGRIELLMSKLFALCDRGIDLQDCVALSPTPSELEEIRPWLELQDANPDWPSHVRETIDDLRARLGNGI